MNSKNSMLAFFIALLVSSGFMLTWAKDKPVELSARERAACQAYLAQLRALQDQDTIVEADGLTAADKFVPPSEMHRPAPEYPHSVSPRPQMAVAVLAGVVELDGTISYAKLVVPSGSASFDEYASKDFRAISFGKPGYVAGKPVRWFFTLKSYFHTNAPGT
jgi:hypothetical protein